MTRTLIDLDYWPPAGWSMWCNICGGTFKLPSGPGGGYEQVPTAVWYARRHVGEHAAGAIAPGGGR